MLKSNKSFDKSASRKNNSINLVFKRNNSNNEIVGFGINNSNIKFTKKLRTLKN